MKPLRNLCFLLLLLIVLAACSKKNSLPTTTKPANTATSTLTSTLTAVPSPTSSPSTTPTQKILPTATESSSKIITNLIPTPLPTVEYRQACITVEDSLPPDLKLEGALLLSSDNEPDSLYHLDLMSQRSSPFTAKGYASNFFLSPDGKWMAYLDITRENNGQKGRVLKVANAEGRHIDMSYWQINWQWIVGWRDEKTLLLAVPGYPGGDFIFLNPFTMQKEVVAFEIPQSTLKDSWSYPYDPLRIYPSPSFSHMTYLPYGNRYSWWMVNIKTGEKLWEEKTFNTRPIWSLDGRYFVYSKKIIHQNEQISYPLLRVDHNGERVQITNQIGGNSEYYWSPDSRFLAAWLQIKNIDISPQHLVLIDIEKPQITDLCIQNPYQKWLYYGNSTVWSPEGRFLATTTFRTEKNRWGWGKKLS